MGDVPTTTAPGSQTLARGLSALQLVADAPAGMTVQQVADGVGVHRTIAYRLLATLAQFRFVAKGEDGRYRPASGLALLGASFDRNLRQLSVPILRASGSAAVMCGLRNPASRRHRCTGVTGWCLDRISPVRRSSRRWTPRPSCRLVGRHVSMTLGISDWCKQVELSLR